MGCHVHGSRCILVFLCVAVADDKKDTTTVGMYLVFFELQRMLLLKDQLIEDVAFFIHSLILVHAMVLPPLAFYWFRKMHRRVLLLQILCSCAGEHQGVSSSRSNCA